MMEDLPNDPMSTLAEQATNMHELYLAFVESGFSPDQAMQLLASVMTAALRA
jgi:hypothetical protein